VIQKKQKNDLNAAARSERVHCSGSACSVAIVVNVIEMERMKKSHGCLAPLQAQRGAGLYKNALLTLAV
jgi:hypothetical protein